MEVTVCCGTFGDPKWAQLANDRAKPSALRQTPNWIHVHAGTLAEARNRALAEVETEFVIFLDADDELTPGYVEAMSQGSADLRGPSIVQVQEYRRNRVTRPFMPRVWRHDHDCTGECLRQGNWLLIGTCARTSIVREVGGFPEGIEWSEDWALWAKCWKAGATVEAIPAAVYKAWVRLDSRNHAPSPEFKNEQHRKIERLVWPEEFATGSPQHEVAA